MDEGSKGLNNNINININQPALVANTKTLNGIAYFLVTWFVGFFGVHRFMRGQAGMGVLYILTFGLFGIGWMIDWILSIVYLSKWIKITKSILLMESMQKFKNSFENYKIVQNRAILFFSCFFKKTLVK